MDSTLTARYICVRLELKDGYVKEFKRAEGAKYPGKFKVLGRR